jgi:hypothetical protein
MVACICPAVREELQLMIVAVVAVVVVLDELALIVLHL